MMKSNTGDCIAFFYLQTCVLVVQYIEHTFLMQEQQLIMSSEWIILKY